MSKYEVMYILRPTLDEAGKAEVMETLHGVITSNGGTITNVDEWGKKRLAYPINYINDGYYVLMYFSAPAALPAELERNFKISDDVLRYIVINLDKE